MLEKLIAHYCGPALAGIKPANLVACYKSDMPDLKSEIKRLNGELNCRGIYLKIVCECEKRALLLVYRKEKIAEYLKRSDISELLSYYGYGGFKSLDEYIKRLEQRLKNEEFPHEIGAFLGYPVHDIYGFINHKEKGCLLVGEWRVYKDAEGAKRLFERYKNCRCAILRRMEQGKTLAQIFGAA